MTCSFEPSEGTRLRCRRRTKLGRGRFANPRWRNVASTSHFPLLRRCWTVLWFLFLWREQSKCFCPTRWTWTWQRTWNWALWRLTSEKLRGPSVSTSQEPRFLTASFQSHELLFFCVLQVACTESKVNKRFVVNRVVCDQRRKTNVCRSIPWSIPTTTLTSQSITFYYVVMT